MPRTAPESLDTDLAIMVTQPDSALRDAIITIDTENPEVP